MPEPPLPESLLGAVIDKRYRIDRVLSAEGGQGIVYQAYQIAFEHYVALKVLRTVPEPSVRERFLREARSARRVQHEHIVHVLDCGELQDGRPYLVMELLQGQALKATIASAGRAGTPPLRVCHIGAQIADALQAVHEAGIIHRDLKPDNIFVLNHKGQDFIKILDFGIAKIMAGQRQSITGQPDSPESVSSSTMPGMLLGTPWYMAPEQISGESEVRTDQYALGCILYEMLTGRPPFDRAPGARDGQDALMGILGQHVTRAVEPPRRRRPDLGIPASLEGPVLRLLAKLPEERFADMAEVARALRREAELLKGPYAESSTRPLPSPVPDRPAWRMPALVGGGVALVGLLVLLASGVVWKAGPQRLDRSEPARDLAVPPDLAPLPDLAPAAELALPSDLRRVSELTHRPPAPPRIPRLPLTLVNQTRSKDLAVEVICSGVRPFKLKEGASRTLAVPDRADAGCQARMPGRKEQSWTYKEMKSQSPKENGRTIVIRLESK